jgi:hypothetical protein
MSQTRARNAAVALVVALTLGACAGQRSADGDASATASGSAGSSRWVPATTTPSASTDPARSGVPAELLAEIMADASERAGVAPAELEVITAEEVTFTDGSLGCPEPGMAYTQALVDGYHVVIGTPNGELDYRAATSGGFRYCANPAGPGTTGTQ